jgi:hypothetical protein
LEMFQANAPTAKMSPIEKPNPAISTNLSASQMLDIA